MAFLFKTKTKHFRNDLHILKSVYEILPNNKSAVAQPPLPSGENYSPSSCCTPAHPVELSPHSSITQTHKGNRPQHNYTKTRSRDETLTRIISIRDFPKSRFNSKGQNSIIRHLRIDLPNPMDLLEILRRNPSVDGSTFRDIRRSRIRKFDILSNFTYAKKNYMVMKNMENGKDFVTGPHPETRRRSPEKLALGRKLWCSRVEHLRAWQALPLPPLTPPFSSGANGRSLSACRGRKW